MTAKQWTLTVSIRYCLIYTTYMQVHKFSTWQKWDVYYNADVWPLTCTSGQLVVDNLIYKLSSMGKIARYLLYTIWRIMKSLLHYVYFWKLPINGKRSMLCANRFSTYMYMRSVKRWLCEKTWKRALSMRSAESSAKEAPLSQR